MQNQENIDISELKKSITEQELLILYNYIEEIDSTLPPEIKAIFYNLLCELDNELLKKDEEDNDTSA